MFFLALGLIASLRGSEKFEASSLSDLLLPVLAYIVVCIGTVALHEAVHGLFFRVFGGKPQYGIGLASGFLPYAYATSAGRFTMMQMTVIGLAPFVFLSLASFGLILLVPTSSAPATVAFITNFSGAVGDLWMVREMARFRNCKKVWTIDAIDGLEILTADPAAQRIVERLTTRNDRITTRLIGWWLGASMVILMSTTPLLIVLNKLNADRVLIGPSQFPLFVYESAPNGFGIWIDFRVLFVAGFLFAVLCLLFDRRKPKSGGMNSSTSGTLPRPAFL
jgi:hypothetical protein